MKRANRDDFSDERIDALLSGRLAETSPEFERAWIQMKNQLVKGVGVHETRLSAWRRLWPVWSAAVGAAAVAIVLINQSSHVPEPELEIVRTGPPIEELFAMDDVLEPASGLLDTDALEAVAKMPLPKKS